MWFVSLGVKFDMYGCSRKRRGPACFPIGDVTSTTWSRVPIVSKLQRLLDQTDEYPVQQSWKQPDVTTEVVIIDIHIRRSCVRNRAGYRPFASNGTKAYLSLWSHHMKGRTALTSLCNP